MRQQVTQADFSTPVIRPPLRTEHVAPSSPDAIARATLASRAMWRELCELAGDLMFETGPDGCFTFVSPDNVLGYRAASLIGRKPSVLACAPAGVAPFAAPGRTEPPPDPFAPSTLLRGIRMWLQGADGVARAFAVASRPLPGGGARGIATDLGMTEHAARARSGAHRRRAALGQVEAAMRNEVLPSRMIGAALAALREAMFARGIAVAAGVADAKSTTDLVAIHASGTGFETAGDAIGSAIADALMLACDPDRVRDTKPADGEIDATAIGDTALAHRLDVRCGPAAFLVAWRAPGTDWQAEDRALLDAAASLLRSALECDHLLREIVRQARTDVLTGLLTRRAFMEELGRRIDRLDTAGEPATAMVLSLEGFKDSNDPLGSERGDEALCQAASMLRDAVRPTDLVARFGGDEFAIVLDGADGFTGAERAESLCRNGLMLRSGNEVRRIDFSIGLATRAPRSEEDLGSFVRRARTAMLHAKRNGGAVWRASQQETGI